MMYTIHTAVAAGALVFFAPLSETYSNKCVPDANGHCKAELAPTYDTGQIRYVVNHQLEDVRNKANFGQWSQGMALTIVDNKLTNESTVGHGAGYTIANIGKPVSKIGGTFVLKPNNGGGLGAAAFIVWNGLPNGVGGPADSGFHLSIGRGAWNIETFINDPQPFPPVDPNAANVIKIIASGQFSPPLTNDGVTEYSFSATFGTATVTMDLHGPDGVQRMNPATIELNPSNLNLNPPPPPIGNFPCWEVYQADAGTDDKPAFISIFAN